MWQLPVSALRLPLKENVRVRNILGKLFQHLSRTKKFELLIC